MPRNKDLPPNSNESIAGIEHQRQVLIPPGLPIQRVVFESQSQRRTEPAKQRYQAMIEAHLMEHPELPLDNGKVQKALSISATTLAKIKRASRNEGFEIPMTTREYAEWLRRRAGIPKRPSSKALEAGKAQRRAKKEAANAEREKLKSIVKDLHVEGITQPVIFEIISKMPLTISVSEGLIRKIIGELLHDEEIEKHIKDPKSPHEIAVFDARVRVFYRFGLSYEEIADLVGEKNLSNINNSLVRSEGKGLVTRRKQIRHGRKGKTTNSS
ncbi:MAG TPA: hypothetical protein VLG67_02970 [Candidatus Saccharimonadales bacterium]|nr:hypothetical protein [Candidatus Saccharimonadales bacterium]